MPYIEVLLQLQETKLLERFQDDMDLRVKDIQDRVRTVSAQHYQKKIFDLQSAPGVNRALPLLFTTDEIEKCVKQLDKRYGEPLLGCVYRDGFDLFSERS
jgi:hypothetical protein